MGKKGEKGTASCKGIGSACLGRHILGKPVNTCRSLDEVFLSTLTTFGGADLRRGYLILREVIEKRIPLVIAVAGPITVSDQHRAWLIPLMKIANVAYITVTDAICYHDGHAALKNFKGDHPIREVPIYGDDARLLEEGIIRVTDAAFGEEVLYLQDRMITAMMQQKEFQRKMTTAERNHLFGAYYSAQEKKFGVSHGLLSTCYHRGIPVFVGAAADGSAFLNSVKLRQLYGDKYKFEYDLHEDVFESCAYHFWGLNRSDQKSMAILILGGGAPKNYSLQPEPTLSQIFKFEEIKGYDYDFQIVSSPVTDGSLSGCFASEAVTWGKVNPGKIHQTASLQADYSTVMPFVVRALVERFPRIDPLRLFDRRKELIENLRIAVQKRAQYLKKNTCLFPLSI